MSKIVWMQVFFDLSDTKNPGWAYRLERASGATESGPMEYDEPDGLVLEAECMVEASGQTWAHGLVQHLDTDDAGEGFTWQAVGVQQ